MEVTNRPDPTSLPPEELEQIKQDRVSRISHDLKSPLASICEAIQIMLEEIPGPLTERQRRLLTLSSQSAERLSGMIGNLLDLSQMDAGHMSYQIRREDVGEILRAIAPEIELAGRDKQVEIRFEEPDRAVAAACDRDRITQALQNVLDNAVKYSPRGGTVRVRLERVSELPHTGRAAFGRDSSPPASGYALISVFDRGPGVSDSEKRKIFDEFHRSDDTGTKSTDGVGLGLSICKRIMKAHSGAIWVEDHPDGPGSVLRIAIPA